MVMPILETDRLWLRPCTREDAADLHALYWNTVPDAFACPHGKDCRPNQQDIYAENEYYLNFSQHPSLRGFGRVLVVLKADETKIGTCLIVPHVFTPEEITLCADPASGMARFGTMETVLGWALTKAYRRQGYGPEALQALVDYGFNTLELRRILAETVSHQKASIRVMEKIGMTIVSPPNQSQIVGMIERVVQA